MIVSDGFYYDAQTLHATASDNERQDSLEQAAGQFEALFVNMLLKQMREAGPGETLFGSEQQAMFQELFDAQIAQRIGDGAGLGVADLLVRQLGGSLAAPATGQSALAAAPLAPLVPPAALPTAAAAPLVDPHAGIPMPALTEAPVLPAFAEPVAGARSAVASAPPPGLGHAGTRADWSTPEAFIEDISPHAEKAAQALGVPSEIVLAQAALETGWGASLPQFADGRSSFNLFGIKADARWSGERVSRETLEFSGGAVRRERADFRAYPSLQAGFEDYAAFLQSNPRYAEALAVAGDGPAFARALQKAGYATDPRYAEKILRVAGTVRAASVAQAGGADAGGSGGSAKDAGRHAA